VVEVKGISKSFGGKPVLTDVSFSLPEGKSLCIIGASGSGKTTLLRMINRMHKPDSGTVKVFGNDIKSVSATKLRREIGYVLQSPALFPHWTVKRNIGLVPRLLHWEPEKIEGRVNELLELMRMKAADFTERYPSELSGGQQQRVGIARALAANPDLILFDEPFSALDPITRSELQEEVLLLKKTLKKTSIFVTHDVREAFLLGDSIVVLQNGKVAQTGSPDEIKTNPANDYIKKFISTAYDD
jgi:osmoprotectant transport system ATP-binding protein